MAEITKYGVTGTTLSEYKSKLEEKYLEIDPDWDIDPSTPDGLTIAAWSEVLANLDEEVINAYHAADPNAGIGQQLDKIARFSGITRKPATYSTASVLFRGAGLIEIPAGTLVRHRVTGTLWATDTTVVTSSTGSARVSVTCRTPGEQTGNAETLTIIASAVGGITSVINENAASLGTDEEKDSVFRIRRHETVALPGNNQIDTIYSSLMNLDDIKQVKIYENVDDLPDENGILGHSMAVFIDGGLHEDILSVFAINKNPGCGLNRPNNSIPGKIDDVTETPLGQPLKVTYFRPEYFSVYVMINIVSDTLSESDKKTIKEAIVDYSIYGFIDSVKFAKKGFRIGETISAGRLYTPSNSIVGHSYFVESIFIGVSANSVDQITIPSKFYQLGVFSEENIEVNIEPSGQS